MNFPFETHEPGIYFDMPEEEYHNDPSFSASGCKELLIGMLDFWHQSHFNKDRPEENETDAKTTGKAYHKMFLEGPDAFESQFAVAPCKDDYKDLLVTNDEMAAWLVEHDLKKGGTKAVLADRIINAAPNVNVWHIIEEDFKKESEGKTVLKRETYLNITKARTIFERLDHVKRAFSGGCPEVSIFWIDKETGIPMKARLDYLKPTSTVDLKTFARKIRLPLELIPGREIVNFGYHIQPVVYKDAVMSAKEGFAQFGDKYIKSGEAPEWLPELGKTQFHPFYFVFVQTGDVPNIIPRQFAEQVNYQDAGITPRTEYWKKGENDFQRARYLFKKCVEEFGRNPWVLDHPASALDDVKDFPAYFYSDN